MAPLRKLAVLLLTLLTSAIAATTPASFYTTGLSPASSPSYVAAVGSTQLSARRVTHDEEWAETLAEAEEDEEMEEDEEEDEEDSSTTSSASFASSASYTDSASPSETGDSEDDLATVTAHATVTTHVTTHTRVTVTVAADESATATDDDSDEASTSTSSTTSSATATEDTTVDAKETSKVATKATASESETPKGTTAASTSMESGHTKATETTARHTKASPSTHASDDTAATSSSETTSKTKATDSASRDVRATTGTSETTSKATAVNIASQDATTSTSISKATDKATATHTADQHTTADTSTAEATSKAPVSESAGTKATATTSVHGTASSSSSAPTSTASSLNEVLTKEDKEEIEDFNQEVSQDIEPVEDSEECKSLPDDPCASIEELAKNPALQEAYKEGEAARKAEKEENGDDDDDDDDDKHHNCDKDDVECIVGATLGSVGGAVVMSAGTAARIISGLGGHPSKVAPWKWFAEAARRIKDRGGADVEGALKDLGNQVKNTPGIDIGPLRGLGLGLGGGTGTPPEGNPEPEDGEGTTIVGPGGTIIGPAPGGKPKPEGGEGGKPDPSTKPPPKTKPEEEPEPEEAEHVECLEELATVSAYNEALQRAFEDIIIDHPDIEMPLDPKNYKGKGPEPCRDNEWEVKNQQLTDKVSDLQKELDEEIASWKGLQDDIRSAPRSCLDEDGKLKKGSGNNRPPKTGKTLSEQLTECKTELRKHNDGQNGCDAKIQKVTDQLNKCQADNAKNLENSKTDLEQLCRDQLDAQKKDLDAEHERALDDARTATKITCEGTNITPGQKITLNVCQQRLSDVQGQLDLSQAYCHLKPGEGINVPDRGGKGKGKGPVQKISKRQVEDEADLEENDEEWVSEAETAVEDSISLEDDPTASNSSLASFDDMNHLEWNPPAECKNFLTGCEKRVGDLRVQVDHLKAEQKDSICLALVEATKKERDRYWMDKNRVWNTEQEKKLTECEKKKKPRKCKKKGHCIGIPLPF